jgi:hypothetical protein
MDLKKLIKENINNLIKEQRKNSSCHSIKRIRITDKTDNKPSRSLRREHFNGGMGTEWHQFSVCRMVYKDPNNPNELIEVEVNLPPATYAHPNWHGEGGNNAQTVNLWYQALGSPEIGESVWWNPTNLNEQKRGHGLDTSSGVCTFGGYSDVVAICFTYEGVLIQGPPPFGIYITNFGNPSAITKSCNCGEPILPDPNSTYRCLNGNCVSIGGPGGQFDTYQDCIDSGCEDPEDGDKPCDKIMADFNYVQGCCSKCQSGYPDQIMPGHPCEQFCEEYIGNNNPTLKNCCSEDGITEGCVGRMKKLANIKK